MKKEAVFEIIRKEMIFMCKSFFDYDDGDFAYTISDNMAVDSDGNMLMRVGDNMAMDTETGDVHFTSGWNDEDD